MKIRFFNGLTLDKEAKPKSIQKGIVMKEKSPAYKKGERSHKFVVLKGFQGEDLIFVVGPEYDGDTFIYNHSQIAEIILPELGKLSLEDMKKVVLGGGIFTVEATHMLGDPVSFVAKVNDMSLSFGAYSPLILVGDYPQQIADTFYMTVEFEWFARVFNNV